MKLLSAHVTNFRSIKAAKIIFDPRCLVLVGINEAGKSNVLKALSALGDFVPTRDDIREPLLNEEPITEAGIEFRFSLTKLETDVVAAQTKRIVLSRINTECAIFGGKTFDLDAFVANIREPNRSLTPSQIPSP